MEIITVDNFSFRYPDSKNDSLNNINIGIDEGDFVLICGNALLPVMVVAQCKFRSHHSLQREPFPRLVGQCYGAREVHGVEAVLSAIFHKGNRVVSLKSETVVITCRELICDIRRSGIHIVEYVSGIWGFVSV